MSAAENALERFHRLGAGLAVGETVDTRTETGLHMVGEAGTRELAVDLDVTGPNLEVGSCEVHEAARHPLAHEGTEVGVAVLADLPGEEEPGPLLTGGDLDVGVGLVVPKQQLNRGRRRLMRVFSRMNASTSLAVTV